MPSRPSANPYRDVRSAIRVAQIFGVTPLLICAGQMVGVTQVTVPLLLTSPRSLLLHQFQLLHERNRFAGVQSILLLSGVLTWLARRFWSLSSMTTVWPAAFSARFAFNHFLLAAAFTSGAALFTIFGVDNVSQELLSRAQHQQSQRTIQEMEEGLEDYEILQAVAQPVETMGWRNLLLSAFGGSEKREALSVHQLVDVWGTMNVIRAGILMASAAIATRGMFYIPMTRQQR